MVTPRRLIEGTILTTGTVNLYTAPDNTRAKISILTVTNTTGTARTVTVYLVAPGGSAGALNTVTFQRTVGPGQTLVLVECSQVLESGGSIQALASAASSLSLTASGAEFTT